jgi:hypothetical protein
VNEENHENVRQDSRFQVECKLVPVEENKTPYHNADLCYGSLSVPDISNRRVSILSGSENKMRAAVRPDPCEVHLHPGGAISSWGLGPFG